MYIYIHIFSLKGFQLKLSRAILLDILKNKMSNNSLFLWEKAIFAKNEE